MESKHRVRFIRKNGRTIPIRVKMKEAAKQAAKGAVTDVALNQGIGTAIAMSIRKMKFKDAFRANLKVSAIVGGVSFAIRGARAAYDINRSKK